MMSIREEQLMAHLDGELSVLEEDRVARALAEDEALRAEAEAQRRLKEKLARRYDAIVEEPVPDRLRAMLETNVVPLSGPRRSPHRPGWPAAAAIAASLALAVVALNLFSTRSDAPDAREPVAGGILAAALDTQLASTQTGDAPILIGISFAARDGRLCRTFEADATAGLACRGGSGWQVVASARSAPRGGEYRQAGSGSASVMEAAEKMMVGGPFEAKAERAARDKGWSGR